MTHSHDVYISLAFLIAWYHITWRGCLYDDFMSLNNNKTYSYLHVKCPYFCPILIKFGIFWQTFHWSLQYLTILKSAQWEQGWYIQTDRWTLWRQVNTPKKVFHFLYGMIWLEVTVTVVYLYTICPDYHILEKYSFNWSFMTDNLWIINLLVFKLEDQSLLLLDRKFILFTAEFWLKSKVHQAIHFISQAMMESPSNYGFNFQVYKNVQKHVSTRPDASVFSVCLTGIIMELCISPPCLHKVTSNTNLLMKFPLTNLESD